MSSAKELGKTMLDLLVAVNQTRSAPPAAIAGARPSVVYRAPPAPAPAPTPAPPSRPTAPAPPSRPAAPAPPGPATQPQQKTQLERTQDFYRGSGGGTEARREPMYKQPTPPPPPPGSDAEREALASSLRNFVRRAQPTSTVKTYSTYQTQFLKYCETKGWDPEGTNADMYVAAFVASRATGSKDRKPLSYTTILGPVTGAMADLYRFSDTPTPAQSPMLAQVKKAVRHVAPAARKAKAPLPLQRLREALVNASKDKHQLTGARDACILLIMYSALLRQSEVVRLTRANIVFAETRDADGKQRPIVSITVDQAKNDQEKVGHTRIVPGQNDRLVCLCSALRKYVALRDSRVPTLFYRLSDKNSLADKKPLASVTPSHILKKCLPNLPAAESATYASNSLRKGGATAAFRAGVERLTIKRHGNWKSDAVDSYIQVSAADEIAMVDRILTEQDEEPED